MPLVTLDKDVQTESANLDAAFYPTRPAALQTHNAYPLGIEFTGSGSEYFRIWIVNLMLLFITLGIYYPWAKVRRLRYFHTNTLVGGEPLNFHGRPIAMLKGYLLVGAMFAIYSVAGNFSSMAGLIAFGLVAAVSPALLKSSMQFRLANTSWRGMRFRFKGTLNGAYRAVLPLFFPGLVILAAVVGVVDRNKPPTWYLITVGVVGGVTLVVLPWLMFNLKRYQHNHYALGMLQTSFNATLGSFYGLFFKIAAFVLLPFVGISGAAVLVLYFAKNSDGGMLSKAIIAVTLGFAAFAVLIAMLVMVKPFAVSRIQNLVWSRTLNESIRFTSQLRFSSLLWLTLKNWLLVVLTFGFYLPFAAIEVARLRLQSVTLETAQHPDDLVNQWPTVEGDAAGEAAGDLFGLDIGF
ncbi:MAG: DUF898 domain-containing protein [Chitinophagaceae bacterium]|nr:DUF898 domain-containing protein [Polaromonas sp.]